MISVARTTLYQHRHDLSPEWLGLTGGNRMSMTFSILFAAKLLGSVLTIADAAPPKFNVAPSCKTAIAITQAMRLIRPQDYPTCMEGEESARQELVQIWTKYKAQNREVCATQAAVGGTPSYVEVVACLQAIPEALR
jgi:hypothetical protein